MARDQSTLLLRMPKAVHQRLEREARAQGLSMNRLCLQRIAPASGSPSLPPTHAPTALSRTVLTCIRRAFGDELVGLVLFGSTSRGDYTEASDIDLLIALSSTTVISPDWYRIWDTKVATRVDARLSPHLVRLPNDPHDASSLWLEAAIEGTVLWERHALVTDLIRALRREFAEGRLQRKQSHGQPYWIREEQS